jgi:hypothetical protein
MSSASTRNDLKAVRRLLSQADMALDLPAPAIGSARESLKAALALTSDIIKHSVSAVEPSAAAALGSRGGNATLASKGPEYFKQISAMRKKKAGGRPRKEG